MTFLFNSELSGEDDDADADDADDDADADDDGEEEEEPESSAEGNTDREHPPANRAAGVSLSGKSRGSW